MKLELDILSGKREKIIDGTPEEYSKLYTECWNYESQKRPNMQQVVSTLNQIVRCFGISQDVTTKEYLLVMQYANCGDLRNYLKDNFKKLTWEDKKRLAFQIADGLNYLHNENVLHRDLHSKNIVIHENNAKIIDFDIYSFGVLMWEISSGCPPFEDCLTENEKVALICAGKREIPIPETPKEYEELYIKCWDQEPKQRPTISEVLKEFEKMGFGVNVKNKIIEDNSQSLGSNSSLYIS
ncbi:unnamed protein product [Rhizophagus irregularis]|nr:unnamed protein product [Rhizophagus irregularis]